MWRGLSKVCELFNVLTQFALGEGVKISFWRSRWCSEVPLCRLFPKLFAQSKQKSCVVAKKGSYSSSRLFEWKLSFNQSSQKLDNVGFEGLSSLLQRQQQA